MIVAKFGGSSVRDASAFKRCQEIIKKQDAIKIVILSATYNTTNELEEIFSLSESESESESDHDIEFQKEKYQLLINRHKALATDLCIKKELSDALFNQIDKEYQVCQRKDDYLALGELMSSHLFYHFLKMNLTNMTSVKLIDARTLIKTDSLFGMATPNVAKIKSACQELDRENSLIITQGFIGSDDQNNTTTLGREGSDYTASLLAAAIGATEVQIWTDVDGVYSADPRLVSEAKPIAKLSYKQAAILAENGAKVLFPQTLAPVIEKKIPVRVKSSLFPEKEGSIITDEVASRTAVTSQRCEENENEYIISVVGPQLEDKTFSQHKVSKDEHIEALISLHQKYCL